MPRPRRTPSSQTARPPRPGRRPVLGIQELETRALPSAAGMVADINKVTAPSIGYPDLTGSARLGNKLFYAADDGTHGQELWVTDGTAAGTHIVKDVNPAGSAAPPGFFPSGVSQITAVGSSVYFAEDDGTHGNELWMTDGTAAGTHLVKDINPLMTADPVTGDPVGLGSNPTSLTAVGDELFFVADDGTHGPELWKSDGTAAGTHLVKDITTDPSIQGPFGTAPLGLTTLGGHLLFWELDADHGEELWTSDGTAAGTHLLDDINPGPGSAITPFGPFPGPLTVMGGNAYFAANDGTHGNELWMTDGTAAGTTMVKDINPGSDPPTPSPWGPPGGPRNSNPADLTVVGGKLFFSTDDGTHGQELWISDGTAAGTTMVKDINPNTVAPGGPPFPPGGLTGTQPASSSPANLTAVGGELYFTADDGTHGPELWKSDGTAAGTHLVKDINPGSSPPSPFPWGPPGGPLGSNAYALTVVGNKLYFSADDGSHGRQLWSSDGTAAGTKMVKDINPAGSSSGSGPAGLVALGTKLLFEADDGTHGTELWVSDGSAAGTHLVKDVNQSTGGSSPYELTTAGDSVFFVADDGVHGPQLWATGPGGTARLTSFTGAAPNDLTAVGNTLYFIGPDSAAGFVLWSSDGTVAGTHPVTTIGWGSTTLPIGGLSNLTDVGGKLYFVVDAPGLGQELFTSNGTAAGTKLVKQIAPNPSGPYNRPDESLAFQPPVSALIVVGNKVFFSADDGSNGDELWASDGSAAGTHMVKDINPGSDPPPPNPWGPPGGPHSSNPNNLTAAGGKLYFSADDGTHGRELWSSDGTAAGTTMVKDVNPGGDGAPNTYIPGPSMVALGGKVFFLGDDGVHGPELWVSDGTAGGTQMVKDIRKIGGGFDVPGGNGSVPADLTVVGHQVFFSADDGPHGRELWVSDGTSGGTHLVKDIADQLLPGDFGGFFPASSSPQMLTAFGGVLYFQANDGVHGPELWVSDGTSGGTHLVQDINPGPAWAFQPGGGPFGTSMAAGPNGLYFAADDGTHGIEVWKLKLNHAPTASAGGPYLVTAGQGVTLDATGSSDPDGDKLTYSWDLNGDGVFGDATGANPTLTSAQLDNLGMYPRPMPYQVRVRVDDGQGHVVTSAPVNLFVRVAPVTVSGLDFEVSEGATFNRKLATVFFNNPEVAPPPAGAYKATIDWGDGTTSVGTVASVNGQLTVSGKHNYSHLGSYAVRVSVSLHGGAPVTATATATVDDAAFYVARGSVPATAGRAFHGVVATIQDTNPSGRAGDFTATIDWGDGTTSAGVVRGRKAGGFEVVGDHTYAHTGPRTVQVHVTSVGGKTVTVQDVAAVKPVSLAGQGRTLIVFADKPFTGDLASFTDADPTAWYGLFTASINWGDGHTSKGTVRAEGGKFVVAGGHEYPAMGQYAVVVTVTDRSGDTLTIKGQVNAVAFTGAVKQLGRFRQEFGSELGLPAVA